MGYIVHQDAKKALELLNCLYAEGKDLSALLDELACLARDLLVLKTAPDSGLTMLSGVADDQQATALAREISGGELVRMMTLLQQTMAGFTRSSSRRVDAELCILNLCRPELSLDVKSLNARLTKLEEQIRAGDFIPAAPVDTQPAAKEEPVQDIAPQPSGENHASVERPEEPKPMPAPVGFWTDLASAVRQELRPPISGFFAPTANAPVQGDLRGDTVILRCTNAFTMEMVNKPEVLRLVARKASAQLGREVTAKAVDNQAVPAQSDKWNQLLDFGRAHSDVIKIKEN